ncbi:D-alanine--D-alanine ligase [Alphaproteobacteria bacterium]|nr:D-alanine--D-alanine ligase [Alphaproteobacteria bacterium]
MLKNIKFLILEGGFNEEHEISLSTAKQVKKSFNELGLNYKSLIVNPNSFETDIMFFDNSYICFNALHGQYGEDGQIQKILDDLSFKYTHSNANTSYNCFNKDITKKLLNDEINNFPFSLKINIEQINKKELSQFLKEIGQFVIKPVSSGSSFGVVIIKNQNDIYKLIKNLKNKINFFDNHDFFLVEKYIIGKELTVGVIEKNSKSIPLEVTEIEFKNNFYDYNSKYKKGLSKHIIPAQIPNEIYEQSKNISKIVHDKMKCKSLSRSDFIYDGKKLFFLEINSQPGLTPISLLPEQLKYNNITFNDLINNIINSVL